MIELVRFIDKIDKEDVPLKDPSKYDVYDSGDWLVPVGTNGPKTGAWLEATEANAASALQDNDIRMARLVWMEKGRTDARAIGKFTVIRGESTRIKTDCFDGSKSYSSGMLLTLKASDDPKNSGKFVLAPASSSDVVKAVCYESNLVDKDGHLTFELVD